MIHEGPVACADKHLPMGMIRAISEIMHKNIIHTYFVIMAVKTVSRKVLIYDRLIFDY